MSIQPEFRYEDTPWLMVKYSCSGIECRYDSIEFNGYDRFVCKVCGTKWDADEAYDGADGELYADWSGKDVSALPVKEL